MKSYNEPVLRRLYTYFKKEFPHIEEEELLEEMFNAIKGPEDSFEDFRIQIENIKKDRDEDEGR